MNIRPFILFDAGPVTRQKNVLQKILLRLKKAASWGFPGWKPLGTSIFYGHKDYQRKGVGRALFAAVEAKAGELGLRRLYAEVSITAKPFILSKGFAVGREQQARNRGQVFTNYVMAIILIPAPEISLNRIVLSIKRISLN